MMMLAQYKKTNEIINLLAMEIYCIILYSIAYIDKHSASL